MNVFGMSKIFFKFVSENRKNVTTAHISLYFYCINLCNTNLWKKEFGLPTDRTMDGICVGSYKCYIKSLRDLHDWGFLEIVCTSKNQYTANIISLVDTTITMKNE